ncbi:hypothetical protein AcV5_010550 [Taiwanofungus camphoratus]|nr:hypothetical protein AcV5_010550 [Antrodia cinnamomea]
MVSNLAAQLAQGASVNSSILVDRFRRRPTESYLFSANEAIRHDLHAIYALGSNGFLQLKSMNSAFCVFENSLFSDAAKATDRTLQPADANVRLDQHISSFLPLLGPYLMDAPAGKVIEWLVRRFRINEFNVEDILTLFLPYHESPHFAKMVAILHIDTNSNFRFLLAYKSTAKTLTRGAIVTEMLKNSDFSRFVANLLPAALREGGTGAYRGLVAFHTSILLDFIAKNEGLDEGTAAFLLPASMEALQIKPGAESRTKAVILQESILGSFLVLAALSQKCHFSSKALKAILSAVTRCAGHVTVKQLVRTLLCICAPQDELEKLPRGLIENLLMVPGIDEELKDGLAWVGAEKLIGPLVNGLIARLTDEAAFKLLSNILSYAKIPSDIVRHATSMLLGLLIESEAVANDSLASARKLLSNIQQHHMRIMQLVYDDIIQQNEDKREAVGQIVLSLSMNLNGVKPRSEDFDPVLASVDVDPNVRAIAVRNLFSQLSSKGSSATDIDTVKTALWTRVQDSNASVIEALYANPSELLPVLLERTESYISSLAEVLHSNTSSPSRNIIRLHLAFLANHFFTSVHERDAALASRIVDRLFFPYLLFSKPRQKTAALVWEILEAKENDCDDYISIGRFELLGGCIDAIRWEQNRQIEGEREDEGYRNVELFTRLNLALASKIADNILASNNYSHHLEALLLRLQDTNAYSRDLGYLITRTLLSRLSGERQIDAGHQIIQAMKLESLDGMGDFMRGVDNLHVFLYDMSLGTAIVLKPSSHHTTYRLQVAILAMLPNIPRPAGVALHWLTAPLSTWSGQQATDNRVVRYVQLMRAVYKLSNSMSALPLLSTHLLRMLFISLGDDALAFLAGEWLSSPENGEGSNEHNHIRHAALRHAAAFFEAHYATERWTDFQTILPAILCALHSTDRLVREAATECVTLLKKLSQTKEISAVYAYDTIYGKGTANLQYLDWLDFRKYTDALSSARDHLVHDANYLHKFHQQHLTINKSDSKKQARYKQRVICYLISHVNACQLPGAKLTLLKSIEMVSNENKAQELIPTLQLVSETMPLRCQTTLPSAFYQALSALAVSSFDTSAATYLNDPSKPLWPVFEATLSFCFTHESMESTRSAITYQLQHGLFAKLSSERKVELCQMLLGLGSQVTNAHSGSKQLLSSILVDVPVIIRLLKVFDPPSEGAAEPANKRLKLDNSDSTSTLSTLAEALASKPLPGSLELISCLLETLSKVAHDPSIVPADRSYIEQLLMIAAEGAVANVPETPLILPVAFRVEVLVELIRASESPQTFHQALLLMASLARLAPEAVLHNVMPVFTFMGSNIFHRDDTYSFRVVQKTVDCIVPVMVTSLKKAHTTRLDLYIGSRDFLRLFTDAANHIPRHRRAKFFSHLVDVLGPDEFLSPVCMLLIDKMSNRVVRQNTHDAQISLSLPLAAFHHYSTELHLSLLIELVREVHRLVNQESDVHNLQPTFLPVPQDDDQGVQSPELSRRRALALLIFCDHVLKGLPAITSPKGHRERSLSSDLLSQLLLVAVTKDEDEPNESIILAARTALASTVRVMSAWDFVTGITEMVESQDVNVQTGAMELLSERLTSVADRARRELTSSVIKIIDFIKKELASNTDGPLTRATFHALRTISATTCPGEEISLTSTVPLVLGGMRERTTAAPAIQALSSLCSALGPRIIPYLESIVQDCAAVVRDSLNRAEGHHNLSKDTLGLLQGLLSSIPTFWSDRELVQVISLYLDSCTTVLKPEASVMAPVIKVLAKRTPSKVLLPTLSQLWSFVRSDGRNADTSRRVGYFNLMKRAIRAAARPIVIEHLRQLFKTFHEAFDISATEMQKEVEPELIPAFIELVVKLNETAFRPLFRKLCDWAFPDDSAGGVHARAIIFCHVYSALLEYFKVLMVPYMSFVWQPYLKVLNDYSVSSLREQGLWLSVLQVLTKTLKFDEGAFWRDDKLQQLVIVMVTQVQVCVCLNSGDGKAILSDCLVATVDIVNDDALLKTMNSNILMHTRSDDARLRIFSLACSEILWRAHGGKLLGFAAETATFIAECAEDENDSVVREAQKLKNAVESVAGNIDAL